MARASVADIDTVATMHAEITQWLAAKGTDQWQRTREHVRQSITRDVMAGTCWLAYSGKTIAGTVTIDTYADPEFWTEEDQPTDAVYVHRMIVRREFAGRGIGKVLIRVAESLARAAGRRWIRLDAWSTNKQLHRYYAQLGFEHVRTLQYPHRGSGALFQRLVQPAPTPSDIPWTTTEKISDHV